MTHFNLARRRPLRWLVLSSLCVALIGCAGGAARKQAKATCGCASYTAGQPRPAWVDSESAAGAVYQSQGIAECTGIKSMDYSTAEKRARDSLGRMINVQVKSEVVSVVRDTGTRGGASQFGQISSEQISQVLLKNSEIFARWVDPASCTVYAGVRIAKADIARAMQEAEATEKAKLVNQKWKVTASGDHTDVIAAQISQALSSLGVTLDASGAAGTLVMSGSVADSATQNDGRVVRVSLKLEARNGGSVVWNRLVQGKGVSFGIEAQPVMLKKAVQDALDNAKDEIKTFMQGSVK